MKSKHEVEHNPRDDFTVRALIMPNSKAVLHLDTPDSRIPFEIVSGEYPIDLPTIKPGSQISITLGHNDDKPRRVELMLRGNYIPTP